MNLNKCKGKSAMCWPTSQGTFVTTAWHGGQPVPSSLPVTVHLVPLVDPVCLSAGVGSLQSAEGQGDGKRIRE